MGTRLSAGTLQTCLAYLVHVDMVKCVFVHNVDDLCACHPRRGIAFCQMCHNRKLARIVASLRGNGQKGRQCLPNPQQLAGA